MDIRGLFITDPKPRPMAQVTYTPAPSIVENVVAKLTAARNTFLTNDEDLSNRIAELSEEQRQTRVALHAVNLALDDLAGEDITLGVLGDDV